MAGVTVQVLAGFIPHLRWGSGTAETWMELDADVEQRRLVPGSGCAFVTMCVESE